MRISFHRLIMDGLIEASFAYLPWKFRRKYNGNHLWSRSLFILLSLVLFYYDTASAKGLFPPIKDLSSFTDVKASSSCGLNKNQMTYCISSLSNSSIQTCTQRTCLLNCCQGCGISSPAYINLDNAQRSSGVYISADKHPYSTKLNSNSLNFQNNGFIISTASASSNFTFATWIKQAKQNYGVLVHKVDVFTISIKDSEIIFDYFTESSPTVSNQKKFVNIIFEQEEWHHVALSVCAYDVSLFIDGVLTRSSTLLGLLKAKNGPLRIGQNTQGGFQYKGLMQDLKHYSKGLTNREIIEAQTGVLPDIPYTDCRCPESHPRLSPTNIFYCMKNGVTGGGQLVQRLSKESHVPEYLVDGEAITYWLSEQVDDVTIEIDLKYPLLQVFLISILFYSPPPKGMKIERSLDFGNTYQAWQYYAVDCMKSFNMINDGALPQPDSVNCIQVPNPVPSWESMTFQPAEAGPDNKPQRPFGVSGCNDFHCSPQLLKFVQATNVKITLSGHTLVTHPDHKYFGIRRIIVGGSCDCYGHARECSYNETSKPKPQYICQCDSTTFTHGDQCDQCLPLYNDKPFARGTVLDAKPCKKCECHQHADSCVYDARLDANPNDRNAAGGGKCLKCKHNTIGQNCHMCKPLNYRPSDKALSDPDVCQPCNCFGPGIENSVFECEKDDTNGKMAGQCQCKKYASGRQCTECQSGYYQLSQTNPNGCSACNCNTPGTINAGISCHISSGQCACKKYVIGVKCTNCKPGYYGLNPLNPDGCSLCNCNSLGSDLQTSCLSATGQCKCKPKFEGRTCNTCISGFYGPTCQACSCNAMGVQSGSSSICNKDTGQCNCKRNVGGTSCDQCKVGYYGMSSSNPVGCMACSCDSKGTVGNTGQCDQQTGVCTCKKLVTGRSCNLCQVGTYGLSAAKGEGCTRCGCDAKGTVSGDKTPKDQLVCTSTGQCSCLSNVEGEKCDRCITGYYWNPVGLGCLACNCDSQGSLSSLCSTSGQCQCKATDGITGLRCNECKPGYYGYNNGRCTACSCLPAGRTGEDCDITGSCTQCKRNVEGNKCNVCKPATINLQASNPYGCSGVPNQQGPPRVSAKNSTSISLAWSPPDDPNGIILKYELRRNQSVIYTGTQLSYTDNNLVPYSSYIYEVYTYTAAGFAKSVDKLIVQTSGDTPQGLSAPSISQIKDRSLVVTWSQPSKPNGLISQYILKSIQSNGVETVHYRGLQTTHQVTALEPFTIYNFTLSACTNIGCIESDSVTISTKSAAPDSQPAPYVQLILGGTSLIVTWDAPSKPNGEIQFYDLFQRNTPFQGEGNTVGVQLKPDNRVFTVNGLSPYTDYEYRIVSYTTQVKGSTASNWTRTKTLEGAPSGQSRPNAYSPSSSVIVVSWSPPSRPSGIITRYEVYQYSKESSYLVASLVASTNGKATQTSIQNLSPYTLYQFSLKACNSFACTTHSSKQSFTTLAAAPIGQPVPVGTIFNSTATSLAWTDPAQPNGPLPLHFKLSVYEPPYSSIPTEVVPGVHLSGFGYYKFSGDIMPDSANTLITFSFKTNYPDGLLLFVSSDGQEDLIVVELRDGKPWLVFDTESGPAAFTVVSSVKFNDGKWHNVKIYRDRRYGEIDIDTYQGSGTSLGDKNVIGQISNVFIGGLPDSFTIVRKDSGPATLRRRNFIGCVINFMFKNVPLDFKQAVSKESVPPLSDHCPIVKRNGLHFKGYGYLVLNKGVFNGGPNFYISFKIMTSYLDSLILYAEGMDTHFIVYIENKQLCLRYKQPSIPDVKLSLSDKELCDGSYHDVVIENKARRLSAIVDGVSKFVGLLTSDLTVASELYVGGVPPTVDSVLLNQFQIHSTFAGCIQNLNIGSQINFQHVIKDHHNVDLHGCIDISVSGTTSVPTCRNPTPTLIYDGQDKVGVSSPLKPYTEYLYRVSSYHKNVAGFAHSKWIVVRTGEGVPSDLDAPRLNETNADSVIVTWLPPANHNGLITNYYVNAYKMVNGVATNSIKNDVTGIFHYKIDNLIPATLYHVTVEAVTSAGGKESKPLAVTTVPAAPEGFSPPDVQRYPTALNITWMPPSKPNGKILFYQVELDGQIKFNGVSTLAYVFGLQVYTKYQLKVAVCGVKGCTHTLTEVYTGELPPGAVIAPQVKVLGSDRVSVKWEPPIKANGVIVKYEVYSSLTTSKLDMKVVFNATASTNEAIISSLTPGTTYYFRIKPYTSAGGTLGDAAKIKTLESAPEEVRNPKVVAYNSTTIAVTIFPPNLPNGVITKYSLIQDGAFVMETSALPKDDYIASGLLPFTEHTFQVQVCTAKGCGFSDPVTSYTGHGIPQGSIVLSITNIESRTFNASWTAIAKPNGPITYNVEIAGEFYVQSGPNFKTENKTIVCYSGSWTDTKYACDGLLPNAVYVVMVNGSNDVGFILSNQLKVMTKPDKPDGISSPSIQAINSTAVVLSWLPPGRSNGLIKSYKLYGYYPTDDFGQYSQVVVHTGMFYSYTVVGLQPFTNYSFWVEAENEIGTSRSKRTNITTLQDLPSGVDAPKITFIGARQMIIEISPPAKPNGIILRNIIYINGSFVNATSGNVQPVSGLKPFSVYYVHFAACTKIGCANSSATRFQTLQDVPEGVSAPMLEANGSRSVVIRWYEPQNVNGIIVCYIVQRIQGSASIPTNVVKLNASFWMIYNDKTAEPYTQYRYRVVAYTSAGGTPSPYSSVTTPQDEPEGIATPSISNITQTSFILRWSIPTKPNGVLRHYIVSISTRNEERVDSDVYEYAVNGLGSYVKYTALLKACNDGGCGSSKSVAVRTLSAPPKFQPAPFAEATSNTSLRVRWDEPRAPNGPIQKYVVTHRTIESLLTENVTSPTAWSVVYEGTSTVFDHNELGVYSKQQYMVSCYTSDGNATSPASPHFRTGPGMPTSGPTISVQVLNHTSVRVMWTNPPFQQLKGEVQQYTVTYEIVGKAGFYVFRTLPGNQSMVDIGNLRPSTEYDVRVSLYNGVGNQDSLPVRITTMAGVPEGFDKPIVYSIGSNNVRISWQPPRTPNGQIMNYTIIANDERMDTVSATTIFHQQKNLKSFTDYTIKLQLCTNFMCILSPSTTVKTLASAPANLAAPTLKALTGTTIEIRWAEPADKNGIMIGYSLYRRSTVQCPTEPVPVRKCTYLPCAINEQLCGTECYDPKQQTCCSGTLHPTDSRKTCCGKNFIKRNSPDDICCGGAFHPKQNTYQCCHGYYRQILSGQVCCNGNSGVVIGNGNSCCGDIPYDSQGDKICLCGALYDKAGNVRQCCGKRIVSIAETCCGDDDDDDDDNPVAYTYDTNKVCCGNSYVTKETSLCCLNEVKQFKVYNYTATTDKNQHQCCGTNRIPASSSCCNDKQYDNSTHLCADRSSDGTTDCGEGYTCPISQRSTAQCDQCSFDTSQKVCGYVQGYFNKSSDGTTPGMCVTAYQQILINTVDPNVFRYVDSGLSPHTKIEYYLAGRNLAGNTTSPTANAMTSMATPESLQPPIPTVISSNQIAISWSPPLKPNGIINKYMLYRTKWSTKVKMMVYTGLARTHLDNVNLEPFTGYMYTLSVCTNLCANISALNLVYTEESAPVKVKPPTVTPVSSTSLRVNWTTPEQPNGVITRYNVTMVINGTQTSILPPNNLGEMKTKLVSNLQPFTEYTFRVTACTKAGCSLGPEATGKTMQALPEGIDPPRVIVLGANRVYIEWSKPRIENGLLKYYLVLRNDSVLYNTTTRSYTDNGVKAATYYRYTIQAHNEAGASSSPPTIITTPESSPQGIPAPTLIPLTSQSINVSWTRPSVPNGVIISYAVLHHEIDGPITKVINTGPMWLVIMGLRPYTFYNIRIEACTKAGCGTGPRDLSRTKESTPFGQNPPVLTTKSSTMVEIKWDPPVTPNGDVTEYKVERRQGDSGLPFIIYIGLRMEYIDSQLLPYTIYHYRVRSKNSAGTAESTWVSVRTFEGVPQAIQAPRLTTINSTSVQVEWEEPGSTNGIITGYTIRHRLFSISNNKIQEVCCYKPDVYKAILNGFKPDTSYEFQISASTSAGSGFSTWTLARTNEALPSSVPTLKANTSPVGINDGTAIEISWDKPKDSNGVVTKYVLHDQYSVVYEGSQRKALVRNLQPFTNYTFRLVICNSAGCLSGPYETLQSGEVTPKGQLPPTVNHSNSSVVVLEWKNPLYPHGEILKYEIIREEVSSKRRRRAESIVHTVSGNDPLIFFDSNVKPFTTYRYKIRTTNVQGSVDSEWVTVTTPEAPPQGLSKVNLTTITDTKVLLEWSIPSIPNGIVRYYNIYRNGTRIDSTSSTQYTDISALQPTTYYSYQIEACTAGGCTLSSSSVIITVETAPGEISPPTYDDLAPTSLLVRWKAPQKPNGVVNKYQLYDATQKIPLFEGNALEYKVTGLNVYTAYTFRVTACTNSGCTSSVVSSVRTTEDKPESLDIPDLFILGPGAIDVRWSIPNKPNGVIIYYLVKRTYLNVMSVVYNGTDLKYTDRTVSPGTSYGYSIEAFNSVGSVSSAVAYSSRTGSSAPQDVKAPVLEALTSSNILAKWDPPGKPNGVIVGYFIMYDSKSINIGTATVHTASGLLPYTEYDFRVKACTSLDASGCATSLAVTARTKEAPPEEQRAPAFESQHIKSDQLQASWHEPRKPNGNIVKYVLYRRSNNENISMVYEGPNLSFTDTMALLPNTRYEYKVVAHNSVGSTESAWSVVTTDDASPSQVMPVSVDEASVTSTSFVANVSPPKEPNGNIVAYHVEIIGGNIVRNITLDSSQSSVTVTGLDPLTLYKVRVYACNVIGCEASDYTSVTTKQSNPSGFDLPKIDRLSSRAFGVSWEEPKDPNGVIKKYEVQVMFSCPQPTNTLSCSGWTSPRVIPTALQRSVYIENLSPYSVYQVTVSAHNQVGSVTSPDINVTTLPEDPILSGTDKEVSISPDVQNTVIIDWSKVFKLQGPLIEYTLYENDLITYTGTLTRLERKDRASGRYRYKVSATTLVGYARKTVTTEESIITVTGGGVTPRTDAQTSDGEPWYKTVWFLALCALVCLLVIFLLIVFCCRGCGRNRTVYVRQREPLPPKNKYGVRSSGGVENYGGVGFSEFPPSKIRNSPEMNLYVDTIYDDTLPNGSASMKGVGPFGISETNLNDEFTTTQDEADFIWDSTNDESRDLDSGLYDDDGISPSFTEPDIETTHDGFVSMQQERILFPDTHL